MTDLTRRTFLKTSALAAAGAALPARSWARVIGSHDDLRVAVIGLNGRGQNHISSLKGISGVRIVALCDADTAVLDRVKMQVNGGNVQTFTDMRQLFASPDIDAVTIATPNHWHSLAAIWAVQAGKDVYVEKPVSHNVWEGRQLVNAARRSGRVVQAGMQIRSSEGIREAVEFVRAGNLGKITVSRGFCYKRRDSIGKVNGPQPVSPTIDYDLWSGPAPLVPPMRNTKNGTVHYDWHWIWLYGNGDVGNQGIHQMDIARWFLGEPGLPRRSLSLGGRVGYVDDGQTPNTQIVIHDYATAPLLFEVRGLPARAGMAGNGADPRLNAGGGDMDKYRGVDIGNVIDCEGGSMIVPSYTTARAVDKDGKVIREFKGPDRHMQNFIDVVRSRKTADLYGPVHEGHVSSALCHLGNISHRLGETITEAQVAAKHDASPLSEAASRMLEHLHANKVDLGITPLYLGAPLAIAAGAERFSGDGADRADAFLTRDYRTPFTVPSIS